MSNSKKIAVKVENLTVTYENGVNAIDNVSFEVYEGDFLGIIGPNGGGKTTLLKAMLNLIPVNSGSVEIFGAPINKSCEEIGYVPQFSAMNSSFPISVKEVVLSGFLSSGKPVFRYSAEMKNKADEVLRLLNIYDKKDCLVQELSGGQRQRLLIARALVSSPKILVLDEPTASVDPASSENIFEILSNLKGVTIIMVTHDVFAVSTKIRSLACLNKKLVYHGEPQLTKDTVETLYNCPVELIAHGVPHRVLGDHDGCSCSHSHGGEV
jgi:zinc transport system ATP-binding protein